MVKITLVSLIIGFIVLNCHDGFGSVGGTITVVHTNNENWIINYNLDKKVVGIMLGPETTNRLGISLKTLNSFPKKMAIHG